MEFYQKIFFVFGSFYGFLSVMAGAFGSHLLKNKLAPETLQIYEVAVRYQMYHALVLIGVAAMLGLMKSPWFHASGWTFIVGTLIFSGSLYILVFSGNKYWGAVTPIGGVLLLLGWLFLILGALMPQPMH